MKEIFKLIYLILDQIIRSSSIYSKGIHVYMAKLGGLIEDFKEEQK